MEVTFWAWAGLAAVIGVLITVDIVGHVRTPHAPSLKEASVWSFAYVLFAMVFAGIVWGAYGADYAGQYLAGWATEKALSIDNLFVFVIIMAAFRVPRAYQQKALLSGIIIALVLRLVFILVGASLVARFSEVFYLFGAWLLWTAYVQAKEGITEEETEEEYHENRFTKMMRKFLPITDGFVGDRFLARQGGRTYVTPLLLCVFALGSADLMFAFDSIPAIFGLTQEPYLVFSANAFALLGLRQLYFLIDGLLTRLVYLHYGLSVILAFIGVKLILHAMHENNLPFINNGQGLPVPEIGIPASLSVIVGTITVTVIASFLRTRYYHAEPTGPEASGPDVSSPDVSATEVNGPEVSGPEGSGTEVDPESGP